MKSEKKAGRPPGAPNQYRWPKAELIFVKIHGWLCDGYTKAEIVRKAKKVFEITRTPTCRWIDLALKENMRVSEEKRDKQYATGLSRLNRLYQKAVAKNDIYTAMAITEKILELTGAKHFKTSSDDEDGNTKVKQQIKVGDHTLEY